MKPDEFISGVQTGESQHSVRHYNASNMTRQISTTKSLALRVTLTVLLLLQAAPSQTAPHHVPPQQQQQLLYYNHVTQPQALQSTNVVVVPENGASIQQFAASGVPLPVGGQYLLIEPGANPVLYLTRSETEDSRQSGVVSAILSSVFNQNVSFPPIFSRPQVVPPSGANDANKTAEQPTVKPDSVDKEKPIKLVEGQPQTSGQKFASLEKFDEDVPSPKPAVPILPAFVPVAPGQRFVVVGQPQFFGNFDALRNHAVQQGLSTNGAVSSFLLLKNQQVIPLAAEANGKFQEAGNSVAEVPGASALEFQRYLSIAKQQQAQQDAASVSSVPVGYQNVVYVARQPVEQNPAAGSGEDSASVIIEALKGKPHVRKEGEDGTNEDTEDVEANPLGPSVAQVKPQAIALAGPGGVAAAAPIGTALVGPGGLALAAPSATAVAGPSGGAPPPPGAQASAPLSSPAAYKAYLLEQQAKGSEPTGFYHVAYHV